MVFRKKSFRKRIQVVIIAITFMLGVSAMCSASDLVIIYRHQIPELEEKLIETSASFYGASEERIDVESTTAQPVIAKLRGRRDLRGIIVSGDARDGAVSELISHSLQGKHRVPVLLFALGPGSAFTVGRGNVRCEALPDTFHPSVMKIESGWVSTGLLGGWSLPNVLSPTCRLFGEGATRGSSLLTVADHGRAASLLFAADHMNSTTFAIPALSMLDGSWQQDPLATAKAFSFVSPFLLFTKLVMNDHGWHSEASYANLTIDDPWLVESYGHLDYARLLAEMETHNFHTTIAFIPWNYDRSHSDVAALLRAHKNHFSICIHGDDHSHQEFAGAEGSSIVEQSHKIRQAIARMDQFSTLTGLPYDRFMIFPHKVAAEETFAKLSEYGFLGTANSIHVPADKQFPSDPLFLLRPYTRNYGNLLSIFRYSAETKISREDIAVHLFLGNPILFYGHQQLFEQGISAFDDDADFVNRTDPSVRWASLGDIARHAYLTRKRDDGRYDIRMLSDEATVESLPVGSVLYIEQPNSLPGHLVVEANDRSIQYTRRQGTLYTTLVMSSIPMRIRIYNPSTSSYDGELLQRRDIRVWMLRRASDFRDMTLSQSAVGRKLISAYYQNRWDAVELRWERQVIIALAAFVAGIVAFACLLVRRRKIRKSKLIYAQLQSSR